MTWECETCGTENSDRTLWCGGCDHDKQRCEKCGMTLTADSDKMYCYVDGCGHIQYEF